jgi:PilZ domain
MSTQQKPELRKEKRISAKVPVTAKKDNGAVQELQGHTRDVSSRGVFMYLGSRVAEGSELELVFPLPNESDQKETWVRCKAKVVRVEQTDTGERFGVAAEINNCEPIDESSKPKG